MFRTRCPICDRVMNGQDKKDWPDLPFCSSRCRLIDLGRWLGESYRYAKEPEEEGIPEGSREQEGP